MTRVAYHFCHLLYICFYPENHEGPSELNLQTTNAGRDPGWFLGNFNYFRSWSPSTNSLEKNRNFWGHFINTLGDDPSSFLSESRSTRKRKNSKEIKSWTTSRSLWFRWWFGWMVFHSIHGTGIFTYMYHWTSTKCKLWIVMNIPYIYMPVSSSSSSKWPFDSLNAGQQQALNRLLVGPNGMGFDTEFCVLEFEIGSSVLEDPAVGHNPGIIKWDLFWGGSKLMHNKWSIKQWPLVV